jgi:hypothetical protein
MSEKPWAFPQPRDGVSITMRQILDGEEPILTACHDLDGEWQFIGVTDANVDDGRIVGLGCMVDFDPTLLELADLPPGWRAVRDRVGDTWIREQKEEDEEEEDETEED